MSEKSTPAQERVRSYLVSQLRRNPQMESGVILERRAKALGLRKKEGQQAERVDVASLRQQNLQELERIRSVAFKAPTQELLGSLERLKLEDFPDLAMLARRLRILLRSREALPPLTAHRHFDGDFFAVLKQVLTTPPREVAMLREQVIASFQHRPNRKRGQAMIRLLKQQLPELYALEGEWLETLLRFQPRAVAASQTAQSSDSSGSGFGSSGWLIGILVVVIGRVVVNLLNSSEPEPEPRYVPPPAAARPWQQASPSAGFEAGARQNRLADPNPAEEEIDIDERLEARKRRHEAMMERLRRGPAAAPEGTPEEPFDWSPE